MTKLIAALRDWRSEGFAPVLKAELENLKPGALPLHLGTNEGGYVDDSGIKVTVLQVSDDEAAIRAKVGVFFDEVLMSCNCSEDPSPKHTYCELLVSIAKSDGKAEFRVISD